MVTPVYNILSPCYTDNIKSMRIILGRSHCILMFITNFWNLNIYSQSYQLLLYTKTFRNIMTLPWLYWLLLCVGLAQAYLKYCYYWQCTGDLSYQLGHIMTKMDSLLWATLRLWRGPDFMANCLCSWNVVVIIYVTWFWKTDQVVSFSISRNTNFNIQDTVVPLC